MLACVEVLGGLVYAAERADNGLPPATTYLFYNIHIVNKVSRSIM